MNHRLRHLVWRGALLALLLIALGLLAVHNLGYPGVWYDEAVQIWVAQGVFPFGPVGETLKGWREVVRNNRRANLDPGGYSLWLHMWSIGDLGLVWLRLSALVFFLLTAALLARWGWELTASVSAAVLAPFILLAYGLVLSFAFEIRAYSMEVAGVVATGYTLHRVVRAPSVGNHLALGLVCAAFLWSRYSFVVVVSAALGALACARVRALGRSRNELEKLACLLVPVLNSGALVYRVTLRYHMGQLAPAPPNPAAAMQAPDYVKPWVLQGQSLGTLAAVLRENFLSAPALPITLAIGALAVWPLLRRRRLIADWPGSSSFSAVATMALLAQLISAALSVKGFYPWTMGQRWSLYLHGISIVCVLLLGSACWCAVRQARVAPALAVAALMVATILTVSRVSFRRVHWADVSPALAHLDARSVSPGSVFVPIHDVPAVRYFYELGPRRGSDRYPRAFRIERLGETAAIDARLECLEYVVSPMSLDALARRIPGVRLTRVPGPAFSSLVRIEPDAPPPAHCAARGVAPSSER